MRPVTRLFELYRKYVLISVATYAVLGLIVWSFYDVIVALFPGFPAVLWTLFITIGTLGVILLSALVMAYAIAGKAPKEEYYKTVMYIFAALTALAIIKYIIQPGLWGSILLILAALALPALILANLEDYERWW